MGTRANANTASGARSVAWRAIALAATLLAPAATEVSSSPFANGLLWRISRAGVPDSFVLGTIHVADPRVAVLPVAVDDALAHSRILAMERVPQTVDAQVFDAEEFDDDTRLEQLIGQRAFERLRRELLAQNVPERVVERMKPWAAMMKITAAGARGDVKSVDEQLLHAARMRRMQLLSLESVTDEMNSFDAVPLESQVALLKHILANRHSLAAMGESAIDTWLRGDLSTLAQVPVQIDRQFPGMGRHYQQLARHVIEDRTSAMHHWLFMPMRGGGVFVAMGASHLGGDKGLLALLERDGYHVTKVW